MALNVSTDFLEMIKNEPMFSISPLKAEKFLEGETVELTDGRQTLTAVVEETDEQEQSVMFSLIG